MHIAIGHMLGFIGSCLSFILLLFTVALAHEIGHFVWAKKAGIRVLELGIGFGPSVFKKKIDNTIYSINMIPVLAFVRLAGLDDVSPDEAACPENEKYMSMSPYQKFRAIAAGPIMNLLLGFFIFLVLSFTSGLPTGNLLNRIDHIDSGSPALSAGFVKGDSIVSIDGTKFPAMNNLVDYIHSKPGILLDVEIMRGGRSLDIKCTPKLNTRYGVGILGIAFEREYIKHGLLSSIYLSATKTAEMIIAITKVFIKLLIGRVSIVSLAGPIGIAQLSGAAASQGIVTFLLFTAFLSINLGVLNLMPIPALDGGRLVFIIIEAIRRRPIDIEAENRIHQWGLTILLLFIFAVSINDIFRIFFSIYL